MPRKKRSIIINGITYNNPGPNERNIYHMLKGDFHKLSPKLSDSPSIPSSGVNNNLQRNGDMPKVEKATLASFNDFPMLHDMCREMIDFPIPPLLSPINSPEKNLLPAYAINTFLDLWIKNVLIVLTLI